MKTALKGRCDVGGLLDQFTAPFAKWRYETLCEVLRCWLPLRNIHAEHVRVELFGNPQDVQFVRRIYKHAKDKHLDMDCLCVRDRVPGTGAYTPVGHDLRVQGMQPKAA